jgi:two-component system NtrC family response regulator
VLQDRTYESVGDSRPRTIDVRVVSATNRDLGAAMASGAFREDLYYRLNLITVPMPSLADRSSDVPLLAAHFLAGAAAAYGRSGLTLTDAALKWLGSRPWPGNVRQLKHLVERTVLLARDNVLDAKHFRDTLEAAGSRDNAAPLPAVGSMTIEEIEKAMIRKSIEHHGGNLSRVAESLGMSRPALYRRLEKYGIPT